MSDDDEGLGELDDLEAITSHLMSSPKMSLTKKLLILSVLRVKLNLEGVKDWKNERCYLEWQRDGGV